ncbi:MAG: hypothetical protein GY755_17815 [Chloroflexi bacterium]|nr:hypothetical protein [Chloroflexota bacterium]
MGANLFLKSSFEPNCAKYMNLYSSWNERKKSFEKQDETLEADNARKLALKYLIKAHERGYFSDGYGDGALLSLFGLSWWVDVAPLTDEKGKMSPKNIQFLLQELKSRKGLFKENLKFVKKDDPTYYMKQWKMLRLLLEEAIDKDEAISCSL